jgi:hypothetical protein
MPSNTISRVDEKLAGKIDELAMASFGQSPIVTAVVTTSHHLELIAWTVATSGLLTRIWHHDGAEASGIDCAFLTEQRVIAAYQGHNGHLEVHAYHLDPAATPIFTKLAHEGGPTASFVRLVGIDDERFASLIVRPTSAAHLTIWRYHSHALESLGRVEWPITFDGAPEPIELAIVCTDFNHLVTCVGGPGGLEFRYWDITDPAAPTFWSPDNAGGGDFVNALCLDYPLVVIATNRGNMNLDLWKRDDYGHWSVVSSHAGPQLGNTPALSLIEANFLGPWFASASRDLDEIFWVQLWEVDDAFKLHLRATQVDSENGATIVAAANSGRGMVTGMKIYDEVPDPGDPEDQLRVKSWTFAGPGLSVL